MAKLRIRGERIGDRWPLWLYGAYCDGCDRRLYVSSKSHGYVVKVALKHARVHHGVVI